MLDAWTNIPRGAQFRSEFARKYFYEGKAEGKAEGEAVGEANGKAEALLEVLDARGLAISEEQRSRILACTDLERLKQWTRYAVSVDSTEELFRD